MHILSADKIRTCTRRLLLAAIILLTPALASAWPTDGQWQPLLKGGDVLQDSETDANGSVNVVPNDGSTPAAYIFNDGNYLFYRLRLDGDPAGNNGILKQFGWGFEIDTDQNPDDYEWLVMIDGISSPEVISLRQNTEKTGVGDPSDKAEYVVAEYPLPGNHRIIQADTSFGGDQDYFLDFRIPYDVFLGATGITENTLIRYFAGSSKSTNNLTPSGADLVGGSDLYNGLGDYFSPTGDIPAAGDFADGSVKFVQDLDGFGDMAAAAAGDTLYIRVDDADQTDERNPSQTLQVLLTAPSGDEETVLLSATGVSGRFTGSLSSAQGAASPRDGMLQVAPDEAVTVTYLDGVDASGSQNVPRTDTILFTAAGTDLAVTKAVDMDVASEGDIVFFTVTVTNQGPNDATGVEITDSLPAGLTLQNHTASSGTYAGGTWAVGPLADDAAATLTLEALVDSGATGQSLTNTASLATIDQADVDGSNDSASATVFVGGTDLRLTKAVSDSYPAEGELIDYTVRVVNLGPNPASGIVVEDLLPAGVTLQTLDVSATQGSYDAASGLWSAGDLAAGAGAKLVLPVLVEAGTTGSVITNTAALVDPASHPDTDSANDSEAVDIKVGFLDLELTKSVDTLAPSQGDTVTFTLTLANTGPNDASGIEVTDLLPVGLSHDSDDGGGSYDPASGLWSIGDLASGGSASLTISATVTADPGQTVINEASITSSHPDDNAANDADQVALKIDGTDVGLTKTVDNPTPNEGDATTFTVDVFNNGPARATGVEITDILPEGVTYASHTVTQGSYDAGKQNSDWVWTVGTLEINASATMTVSATVDSGTTGDTITNVAMLTAADQEDPDETNNVADAEIAVGGTDLALEKTVDNATPGEGETIVYTLFLSNIGPNEATNITVNDLLPPEVEYLSHAGDGAYGPSSGDWALAGPLAASTDPANDVAGGTAALQISARVKSGTSGLTITNTTGIVGIDQGDEDSSNDSASVDITVAGLDLALAKTVDDPSLPEGGDALFTVTVTNSGSFEATGIEIEDALPAGLTFVSATTDQGSYSTDLWLIESLAANASATLQITAAVDTGTAGATITNTAEITALDQVDTDATNDSASVDITPVSAPSLTVIKSASGNAASPGEVITYTVTVLNGGSGEATSVVLTDDMSPYVAWQLDSFVFSADDSGLSLGSAAYSDNDAATFSYTPVSAGGGAADGFDGNVTDWRLPMNGTMAAGGSFTLQYKVMVR